MHISPVFSCRVTYLDNKNKLWRCRGRLHNSASPSAAKHPLILARKHRLTKLIVKNAHHVVQHDNVRDHIRLQYWTVGGRSLVTSAIHNCVTCCQYEGQPFCAPLAPPLPVFIVIEAPPFTYTGIDYAGPLFILARGMMEHNSCKVWICLFTCCITCAVHLELVLDMSALTFIKCLKHFGARWGLPWKFVSDNGMAFKVAARTLKDIVNQPEYKRYLTEVGIEWTFNLEETYLNILSSQ